MVTKEKKFGLFTTDPLIQSDHLLWCHLEQVWLYFSRKSWGILQKLEVVFFACYLWIHQGPCFHYSAICRKSPVIVTNKAHQELRQNVTKKKRKKTFKLFPIFNTIYHLLELSIAASALSNKINYWPKLFTKELTKIYYLKQILSFKY